MLRVLPSWTSKILIPYLVMFSYSRYSTNEFKWQWCRKREWYIIDISLNVSSLGIICVKGNLNRNKNWYFLSNGTSNAISYKFMLEHSPNCVSCITSSSPLSSCYVESTSASTSSSSFTCSLMPVVDNAANVSCSSSSS